MFRSRSAVSAAALVLAACAEKAPTGPAAPLEALPRQLSAAEQVASAAANRFAFDLLRELHGAAPDSNAFISPLSVSMALGMTANGAAGSTVDAMRHALRVSDVPEAELNAAYRDLVALLRGLDPAVDLRIANSVWLQEGFPFHSAFSDVVREHFGATTTTLDLYGSDAITRINGWAGEHTNGKISKVLETMPPDVVALLMNAVYFNGAWRDRFDVARTHDAPFLSGSGAPVPSLLMTQVSTFRYAEDADLQAVELPYGNGAFVMTVLLPKPDRTLATLVSALDAARWEGIVSAMREREVELFLPKLQLRRHYLLNDALAAMGMEPALCTGGGADFSRLSPLGRNLCISFVLHDTFVDVHEEGTEAAAVTTVGIGLVSMPVRPTVRADRPYLFAIRERFSGTILFLGAISSP